MGAGATAGFMLGGGPLGASVGAGAGKQVSDTIQGFFAPKQPTKMEELEKALAMLNGGRL